MGLAQDYRGAWQGLYRKRTAANLAHAIFDFCLRHISQHSLQCGKHTPCQFTYFGVLATQQGQRRQAFCKTVRIEMEAQHAFERSNRHLVASQGALERVSLDFIYEIGSSRYEPALRPTQKFVAAECNDIGSGGNCFCDRRLMRKAIGPEIDQRACAEVDEIWKIGIMCDARNLCFIDRSREALHRIIARMHAHQCADSWRDRVAIVLFMRAVGRADFAQAATRALHDIGHAESAADFDEFASRNNDFPARGDTGQCQQHRGCIVVDDSCCLRACQPAQQGFKMRVAIAALSRRKIEFEVRRATRDGGDRVDRLLRQRSAAEVRVQHRAREVEDRPQCGRHGTLDTRSNIPNEHICRLNGTIVIGDGSADRAELAANGICDWRAPMTLDQYCQNRRLHQPVDGWQRSHAPPFLRVSFHGGI